MNFEINYSKINRLDLGTMEDYMGPNAVLFLSTLVDIETYAKKNKLRRYAVLDLLRKGALHYVIISKTPFIIEPNKKFERNMINGKLGADNQDTIEYFAAVLMKGHKENRPYGKTLVSLSGSTSANDYIIQLDKKGVVLGRFTSLEEASNRSGAPLTNICKCLNNDRATAGGYVWKRANS